MNFEKLFIAYPEVRNMSDTIRVLMRMIPVMEEVLRQDTESPDEVKVENLVEYGHHGVSTKTDLAMQRCILEDLYREFPEAIFLAEEKDKGFRPHVFLKENPTSLYESSLIFGVDPIDGTAHFRHKLWEWSVSVGVMVRGTHLGGMIYGPKVNGGMCVVGERDKGVFLIEDGGSTVSKAQISAGELKKSVLFLGVDFMWMPSFSPFINQAAKESLVARSVGSCALGLASVAAGKAGALIQPVQKPWDWFAGYPLVEEAGGKFQFYHYRDGLITLLDKPDLLAYSPSKPNVGFVAGNPKIVEWLTELLLRTYNTQ